MFHITGNYYWKWFFLKCWIEYCNSSVVSESAGNYFYEKNYYLKKFLKSNQKARRTSKNREVALLNSPYHNSCHKWKHSCSHSITGLPCLIDIEKQILAFSGTIVKNYIGVFHLVRAQNFLDHGERNVSFSVHLV